MSSVKTHKQLLSAPEQTSGGALGNELSGAAPPCGGRTVWFHRTGEEFARNKELIANLLPRPPPQRRWYCVAASKVKCFLSQAMAACALPGSPHLAAPAAGAIPDPAGRQGKGGGLNKPSRRPCQSATERQAWKRCLAGASCHICIVLCSKMVAPGRRETSQQPTKMQGQLPGARCLAKWMEITKGRAHSTSGLAE